MDSHPQTHTQTYPQPQESLLEGKKRLCLQRMLLTYKTHLNKAEYIEWAKDIFKTQGIEFIRCAHEKGDSECGYDHTHVVIELKKRFDTKNMRRFDYNGIHPHIKKLPNKSAANDAKVYIAKEDPENKDLETITTPLYTLVSECKTLEDALNNYVDKPSDAIGIMSMYNVKGKLDFRTKKSSLKEMNLKPWQQDLEEILKHEPNEKDTSIIWIWDEEGQNGKSTFAEYMCDKYEGDFKRVTDLGTARDAPGTILKLLRSGWKMKGIFINLARQTEHHNRMYNYIEQIKDGLMTVQKYDGGYLEFDKPHVVILANWPPRVNMLSMKRWVIFKIMDGGSHMAPISAYELLKEMEEQEEENEEEDVLLEHFKDRDSMDMFNRMAFGITHRRENNIKQ